MNSIGTHVAETVIAFTLLVLVAFWLKKKSILKQEDGAVFAKLLTQAVLPATILYQLWKNPLSNDNFLPVVIMFFAGTAALAISWFIGKMMRFDRQSVGALMIVSSFGSSALIGYPIIQFAFANEPKALAEGIVISELGVGLPIFIFCPAVAMFFGGASSGKVALGKLAKDYFRSPIFIAILFGLALSQTNLPEDTPLIATLLEMLRMTQGATVVVSAAILGMQLSFQPTRGFWVLITISIVIQMVLQPWLSSVASVAMAVSEENKQILVLISSMPAAILGPVFAARYECAAKTASLLAFTHIAISPIIVPLVFNVM